MYVEVVADHCLEMLNSCTFEVDFHRRDMFLWGQLVIPDLVILQVARAVKQNLLVGEEEKVQVDFSGDVSVGWLVRHVGVGFLFDDGLFVGHGGRCFLVRPVLFGGFKDGGNLIGP